MMKNSSNDERENNEEVIEICNFFKKLNFYREYTDFLSFYQLYLLTTDYDHEGNKQFTSINMRTSEIKNYAKNFFKIKINRREKSTSI